MFRSLRHRRLRHRRFGGPTPRILLCATAFLIGGVALAGPALAVAHGEPVPTGRYGFAVKLTMTDIPRADGSRYNSACSAALVAPNWIITAGHCFHDVNRAPVGGSVPYATTATVGRTDLADSTGHVVDVVEVVQATGRDVALGRLNARIFDVRPLRIDRSAPRVGAVLRIAGWGATSSTNPVPATHLQTGQVQVGSVADTTVGVHGYAPATDTSACVYDSGAPYFRERRGHEPALVSVESDGPTCPHALEETTARVDDIAGWISQTVYRRG
jgi:V8-like Glu-specific endopeptidase